MRIELLKNILTQTLLSATLSSSNIPARLIDPKRFGDPQWNARLKINILPQILMLSNLKISYNWFLHPFLACSYAKIDALLTEAHVIYNFCLFLLQLQLMWMLFIIVLRKDLALYKYYHLKSDIIHHFGELFPTYIVHILIFLYCAKQYRITKSICCAKSIKMNHK